MRHILLYKFHILTLRHPLCRVRLLSLFFDSQSRVAEDTQKRWKIYRFGVPVPILGIGDGKSRDIYPEIRNFWKSWDFKPQDGLRMDFWGVIF